MKKAVISLEALTTILCASIETFPQECAGILFGSADADLLYLNFAFPHQIADRGKGGVLYSFDGKNSVNGYPGKILGMANMGDFHSHTYPGEKVRSRLGNEISDGDKELLRRINKDVAGIMIIAAIKKVKRNRKMHIDAREDGTIACEIGRHRFLLEGYAFDSERNDSRLLDLVYRPARQILRV